MPHRRGDRALSGKPSEDRASRLSRRAEPPAIRAGAPPDEAGRHAGGFDVAGDKESCFRFLDALRLVDISNNLGDSKSLVTHPATTTHSRLKPEERAALGISDGLVRLSAGLEAEADLLVDLSRALESGITHVRTGLRRFARSEQYLSLRGRRACNPA